MRPVAVSTVPGLGEPAGRWQNSIKLDGWRTVALRYPDRLVLQSRAGTVVTERFPEAAAILRQVLAPGTMLDAEICAFHPDGRLDFAALQRTSAHRAAAQVMVQFIAFDILCVERQDLRALPLTERWAALTAVLADSPVRPVLATDDRETALGWARDMAPLGVEGIVSRRWDSSYRPKLKRAWVKHRTGDTQDSRVLAVLGPPRRPRAVRVLIYGRTAPPRHA